MSKILIDRSVAQEAIDALKFVLQEHNDPMPEVEKAITAFEQALLVIEHRCSENTDKMRDESAARAIESDGVSTTIEELKAKTIAAQEDLRALIAQRIDAFRAETGVDVTGVNVDFIDYQYINSQRVVRRLAGVRLLVDIFAEDRT